MPRTLNVPNAITLARIALVPLLLYVLLGRLPYGQFWAALVFAVGALTDGVDGYIARRTGQVTAVGKLIDPLADKLLVAAALVALVERGALSSWVVLVILAREFAITGLRAVAAADGVVIAASPWGKLKTALQIAAILVVIVSQEPAAAVLRVVGPWALAAAVVATVVSGIDYGWRYVRLAGAR